MSKSTFGGKNLDLFDASPLTVGSFRFTSHEATAVGNPSAKDWQEAYIFATNAQESSPYWVADLLEYAHQHKAWRPVLDQLISTTGLSRQTVYNQHSLGSRVKPTARKVAQSFTHAAKVVKLQEDEQVAWLEKSRDEGWSSHELEQRIRSENRLRVVGGRAGGMYTVDVTVRLDLTAQNEVKAEELAWSMVKKAVLGIADTKVIASHCQAEAPQRKHA